MPKLTDTQLVILSNAASRNDGAVLPLPKSVKIKGAAATKTLEALLKNGLLAEKPAPRKAEAWREDQDGKRMMLIISDSGLKAIDAGPEKAKKRPAKGSGKTRAQRKVIGTKQKAQEMKPVIRKNTKQALLIGLLKRKNGASIDEIIEATGWQAHSVRGAISGALKKKLGLTVTSEKTEGRGRIYRIVDAA